MAIFDPVVQSTETITEAGLHTFEHGLGTWNVVVEAFDADNEQVFGLAHSVWSPDAVQVYLPADTKLPATLRVVG